MVGFRPHMRTRLFLGGLAAATAGAAWLPGLGQSLWLDETVTAWIARPSLVESIRRAAQYQFSPIAFLPHWLALRVGAGEWALRAPSLLAMAAAAVLVWRLGRRLWDDEAGLLAALTFVGMRLVTLQAATARPYALGVLFVTGAMLFLVRWSDGGTTRDGALWALLAGLTPHIHPLLGLMLLVHAATLVLFWGRRGAPPAVVPVFTLLALVLALLVPELRSVAGRASHLSYAPRPGVDDFLLVLAPPAALGAALIGWWAAAYLAGGRPASADTDPGAWGVLLAWSILPASVLFAISRLTPMNLLVPQYAIAGAPGLALLVGFALRTLDPPRARLTAAVVLALTGAALPAGALRSVEDWRGAASVVRTGTDPATPVVLISGLVESAHIGWLIDSDAQQYLLAPLQAYPVDRLLLPMPWHMDEPPLAAYMDALVRRLSGGPAFVLMTRGDGSGPEAWLSQRLAAEGWQARRVGVPGVHVAVFSRAQRPGP